MIIDSQNPPPVGGFVVEWVRGLDPWHPDVFPLGVRVVLLALWLPGERRSGWEGLDWAGNMIIFVADGTVLPAGP